MTENAYTNRPGAVFRIEFLGARNASRPPPLEARLVVHQRDARLTSVHDRGVLERPQVDSLFGKIRDLRLNI